MKPVQKLCLACIIGLLAASDDAAALEDVGTVVAATDVPPLYSPLERRGVLRQLAIGHCQWMTLVVWRRPRRRRNRRRN